VLLYIKLLGLRFELFEAYKHAKQLFRRRELLLVSGLRLFVSLQNGCRGRIPEAITYNTAGRLENVANGQGVCLMCK